MATLADMKTRIATELRRADLGPQIASAITDAICVYQKQRFRFSDSSLTTPITFNTVVGQSVYGAAANPAINSLHNFDFVFVLVADVWQPLERQDVEGIIYYNQTNNMQGIPDSYGYRDGEIILSPVPYAVWQMRLGVFVNKPAPAADDEAGNVWMNQAEMLIRSRAKYEIALHVTRNAVMAANMSPHPPAENNGVVGATYAAWRVLKADGSRVASLGRIRPMAF